MQQIQWMLAGRERPTPASLGVVLCFAGTLAACSGKSVQGVPGEPSGDAGASGDLPFTPSAQANAPTVEGDGRLPDVPDSSPGNGWDYCAGAPRLRSSASLPCASCPPATRGEDYLISSVADDSTPTPNLSELASPQAYLFFAEPTRAEGLWLDVMWINGPAASQLSIMPTDPACGLLEVATTFDISGLFSAPGAWVTTCVPISGFSEFRGLGFRLDAEGTFALDALRFGPACP